jgi:hypothetical protein
LNINQSTTNHKMNFDEISDEIENIELRLQNELHEIESKIETFMSYDETKKNKIMKEDEIQIKQNYFFLVLNKLNHEEIIINSVRGLVSLTPNNNNLPFQIKWSKNKKYVHQPVQKMVKKVIDCISTPPMTWSEKFLFAIRKIEI